MLVLEQSLELMILFIIIHLYMCTCTVIIDINSPLQFRPNCLSMDERQFYPEHRTNTFLAAKQKLVMVCKNMSARATAVLKLIRKLQGHRLYLSTLSMTK